MLRIVEKFTSCKECMVKSIAAKTLSDEELTILDNGSTDVRLEDREIIMKEGFPHSHVIYLKEGYAKIHMKGPCGRDHIIRISQPGEYIGIMTLLGAKNNHYSATALHKVRVCYINESVFQELIYKNSKFGYEILHYLCLKELDYYKRSINLHQKRNSGRLADAILYFSDEIYKSRTFCLPFPYVDLASLVGTTRESVTRGIKEFIEGGIIDVSNRCFIIKNYEMLKKISENG